MLPIPQVVLRERVQAMGKGKNGINNLNIRMI